MMYQDRTRHLNLHLFALMLLTLILLSACSSSQVRISTKPEGADVYAENNEKLGTTPFELEQTKIDQLSKSGLLPVEIKKTGFEQKNALLSVVGADEYSFNLKPADNDSFLKEHLFKFQAQSNEMVREALTIQGLIVARKTSEAEQKISDFEKKYPNLASVYVLKANLAIFKSDFASADRNLKRAQELDPKDQVIGRMLNQIQNRTPASGGAQ